MAYTRTAVAPHDFAFSQPSAGHGWFRRFIDALVAARAAQVDHEVARYLIDNTGGKFTDQTEREIERRFLSNPTRW